MTFLATIMTNYQTHSKQFYSNNFQSPITFSLIKAPLHHFIFMCLDFEIQNIQLKIQHINQLVISSQQLSMCNSSLITIVLAFLISLSLFLPLAVAQPKSCYNTGTFSNNSTYANNLNLLLSSLPSNVTANGGFYNTSAGQDPNKVYALALCRGDLETGKCYNCMNTSSLDITKQCPDQKEAIIWGAECILRYSNRNIFGTMQVLPSQCVPNPNNISSTDLDQFNQTLYNLMGSLVTQASLGSSSIKYFAVGKKSFSSSRNVYGLVQCTPDLSQMDCRICLEGAVADISSCSGGKEGGRVLKPSCIAWFEVFQFYDSTFVPSSPTTTVTPPTSDNSSPTTPVIPPTSNNSSPTKTRRGVSIFIWLS